MSIISVSVYLSDILNIDKITNVILYHISYIIHKYIKHNIKTYKQ